MREIRSPLSGFRSPFGMTRGGGGGVASLLAGETTGFAADFTRETEQVDVASSGVITSQDALGFFTVGNLIYPPRVRDADNNRVWAPHNLYRNSEAPATQTRTVIVGQNYTVSVVGSGSLTLTNAGTGVVTAGNPVTFTASTTSLVSTLSGSLTRMQLNRGPVPTAYVVAGASADAFGPPISWDAENSEFVLLIEPTRTNVFLNSTAPVTQAIVQTAGARVVWLDGVQGVDSVTLTGSVSGALGTATPDAPLSFTGVAETVTYTVNGAPTHVQSENGLVPTSQIITYGSAVARSGGDVSLSQAQMSALFGVNTEFTIFLDYYYPNSTTGTIWRLRSTAAANDSATIANASGNLVQFTCSVGGASQANFTHGAAAQTIGGRVQVSTSFKANRFLSSLNGAPVGTGQGQDVAGTIPNGDNLFIGSFAGNSGHPIAPLRIRRVVVVAGAKDAYDITGWKQDVATEATAYDVHLWTGQSNTNSGATFDAGIDVSSASVDQISSTGVVSQAVEPLVGVSSFGANRIGPTLAFARDYYVPNRLAGGRKVLIIHTGASGEGFEDNRWNPDDDLYNNAVSLTAHVLKRFPNARLTGIFSSAGENEGFAGWTESQFADAYDGFFEAIRVKVGNVPVVVGGMVQDWVDSEPQAQDVQDALTNTPSRLANSGFASSLVPTELLGNPPSDVVHFSAADQRIRAGRYWDAYEGLTV